MYRPLKLPKTVKSILKPDYCHVQWSQVMIHLFTSNESHSKLGSYGAVVDIFWYMFKMRSDT